jgi:pimeloyl-ACP methyl ester carboxylesterase
VIQHTIERGPSLTCVRDHGNGPCMVFGHSLGFDGEMWEAQVDSLAGICRTLSFDFRGQGRSTTIGPFSLEDLADDVVHVLDVLDIDRAIFCGLSQGGMVGMRIALRHPERIAGLALLNTTAEAEDPARRELFEAYNEQMRGRTSADPQHVAMLMSLMFSRGFLSGRPAVASRFRDKLSAQGGDGLYYATRAVLERTDILKEIAAIAVPTLVIGSTEDTAVPPVHARAIASAITGAGLKLLEGGHMSAVEQTPAVNLALVELLDHVTAMSEPRTE